MMINSNGEQEMLAVKAKRSSRGFSLIELMVTIAVVGIIFAIGIPQYQNYLIKSYRAEAKSCLLELSQGLERRYAGATDYTGKVSLQCIDSLSKGDRYSITYTLDTHSYDLIATPIGIQLNDWACGGFSYNHRHKKGMFSNGSMTGTVADCW